MVTVEGVRREKLSSKPYGGWRGAVGATGVDDAVRRCRRAVNASAASGALSLSRSLMPPVVTGSRVYRQSGSYFGA